MTEAIHFLFLARVYSIPSHFAAINPRVWTLFSFSGGGVSRWFCECFIFNKWLRCKRWSFRLVYCNVKKSKSFPPLLCFTIVFTRQAICLHSWQKYFINKCLRGKIIACIAKNIFLPFRCFTLAICRLFCNSTLSFSFYLWEEGLITEYFIFSKYLRDKRWQFTE